MSKIRSQEAGVRSQESGVKRQGSGVRRQIKMNKELSNTRELAEYLDINEKKSTALSWKRDCHK